jgi:hypothetical protein
MKPRLLDLFCCEGGAARGYQRAGFHVTGVDNRPQPRYAGDAFIQADAMDFPLEGFDVIHASPPCQRYSPHVSSQDSQWAGTRGKSEPALIPAIRARLVATEKPYVIENVMGARHELKATLLLCGTMFGLPIPRHRLFEVDGGLLLQPFHGKCGGVAKRYAEARGWDPRDMTVTGKGRRAGTSQRWGEIMEIDWMTQHGMREAIPPAYTEHIGRWLIRFVSTAESDGATNTGSITPIATAQGTNSSALSVGSGQLRMAVGAPIALGGPWRDELVGG